MSDRRFAGVPRRCAAPCQFALRRRRCEGDAPVAFTPIDPETTDYEAEAAAKHNAFLRKQASNYLSQASRFFEERRIPIAYRVLEGHPISGVLAAEADAGPYDAVVMGSRGMGMMETEENYLGSVTEHVIRKVTKPVIVIPLRHE